VDGKVVSTQKLERTLPLVKPLDQMTATTRCRSTLRLLPRQRAHLV